MRRMSFSRTTAQMRDRTKRVTRRLGWSNLKPGEKFLAVEKCMGLKKGEKQIVIGVCQCVSNRPQPLKEITKPDVVLEGFPEKTPAQFIEFFCKGMRCTPETRVNRIRFRFIEEV